MRKHEWFLSIVVVAVLTSVHARSTAQAKEVKMVVEYIRYEVPTSRAEAFIAAYAAAAKELDASPHCLGYEISRGIEEPAKFTVRIEWDSVQGHEQGFRKSPGFRTFFGEVKPFFDEIREMKHYEVISHRSKAKASGG
jgi:quinol monooxygenase YgiN